ncbi:hypothetical protein ACOSQ2_006722 [Xanthoceras sorbifolium]
MAASAKRPRTEDPSTVNISVKNQALHRTIKRLLSNYWKKNFLEYETIHFLIEGNCFSHPLTCCLIDRYVDFDFFGKKIKLPLV